MAGGFGESETLISSVDADGVALASVQAVYERVRQQDRQIGANLSTRPLSCRRDFGLTRGGVLCALRSYDVVGACGRGGEGSSDAAQAGAAREISRDSAGCCVNHLC